MPRKSHSKWTPDDDGRLLELKAAGKSDRMIALALRRSEQSVSGRLYTLKVRLAKERDVAFAMNLNRR
jgi:DNA-binding NarL/FixJ family response regulator